MPVQHPISLRPRRTNDCNLGAGSIAMDPKTGQVIDGDVKAHTHQVLKNLTAVLEAAGTSIDNVVKVNVFLADMKDFNAMNEVYAQWAAFTTIRLSYADMLCVNAGTLAMRSPAERMH